MEEDIIKSISNEEYKHGFESQIENEEFPRGLNEEIIRMISERKEEPEWLLELPGHHLPLNSKKEGVF